MAQRSQWQISGWPSWGISLVIHVAIFAVLVLLPPFPSDRSNTGLSRQEFDFVLSQATDDELLLETEEVHIAVGPNWEVADLPDELVEESAADLPAMPTIQANMPNFPKLDAGESEKQDVGDSGDKARRKAISKFLGRKARVSVFGIEGVGNKFVYVFDRSISMSGAPLRAAKQQLLASLTAMESVHQFQIIFFHHEPTSWDITGGQSRIAFATDRNKQLAAKFVRRITASGGTSRSRALRLALRLRPDVVFFLSDTDDPMPGDSVEDAIRLAERDATAIHTIEFGDGPASRRDNFLMQLARRTGGEYVYVDTSRMRKKPAVE